MSANEKSVAILINYLKAISISNETKIGQSIDFR